MKNIVNFFRRRHQRHYAESNVHLAFDVILIVVVILLIGANAFLWLYGGRNIIEQTVGRSIVSERYRAQIPQEQTDNGLAMEVRPVVAAFGQQIGTGPHPPRAGEESTYWILVRITPAQNKLTNVVVRGALAHGVRWTGRVSTGSGSSPACEENCAFRWTIGNPAAATENSLFASLDAAFEVAITPAEQRVVYPLLRYLEASGKDGEKQVKTVLTDISTEGL